MVSRFANPARAVDVAAMAATIAAMQQAMGLKAAQQDLVTVAANASAALAAIAGLPASRYLPNATYTIAELIALDPTAASYVGRYAWVSDLWSDQAAARRGGYCVSEGGFWRPVRPYSVFTQANANQAMTLTALVNSPTQLLQGTLTAARTVTLSTTNAWPGARFRVNRAAGGLFGLVVAAVSNLASLGINSWADFEFDGSAWKQTASGGLL